jgi:RNA recognition motif-containing protein
MSQKLAKENDKILNEKKLFVHGFPKHGTTEEEILEMFSQFGKVDRILMGVSSGAKSSFRGFAYIIMEDKESAEALINIEMLKFKKNNIIIRKCREQDKGRSSEGVRSNSKAIDDKQDNFTSKMRIESIKIQTNDQ